MRLASRDAPDAASRPSGSAADAPDGAADPPSAGGSPGLAAVMFAVGLWAFAMALPAIGARATYGARTTADEPQYLTTAISIAEDFDLDISDEIAERRFEPYHEISLNPQTIDLDGSGRRVSPHDPLLPALLALPMRAGGWAAAKAFLAAVGGITAAATVWLAVRRFSVPVGVAGMVVAAFFAAPPLTSYSTQVYPEMPAALCLVLGLAAVSGPLGARGRATAILSMVALPWLSVKYVPLAAVLAAVLAARQWPRRQWPPAAAMLSGDGPPPDRASSRRHLATDMLVLALAAAVYLAFHRSVYGGWTAYASGDHFVDGELLVLGQDPHYLGRSRRLVGLIVDRGFGLAAWTPAYLLAVPAAVVLARRRPPGWPGALAAVAAGYATATWLALTMHGWWWPGRQVVAVLPVVVAAVALLAHRSRAVYWASVAGCAVGVFNWLWLAVEASTGRRTLIVDFEETANPLYQAWSALLPDHRHFDRGALVLTVVWSALLAAAAVWAWIRSRRPAGRGPVEAPTPAPGPGPPS